MSVSTTVQNLLRNAIARFHAGDLARAEVLFTEITRLDRRQPDALHFLGIISYQRGAPEDGLRFVARSLKANPKFAAALNSQGVMLRSVGRPRDALASFDRAIAINPDNAIALNNRGNVLHDFGRLPEALSCYERAAAVQPNYAEAIINKANTLAALGKHDDALANYARGLELEPTFTDGHLNEALTLAAAGRPEQALASFDRAVALRPNHDEALFRRALTLQQLGRYNAAIESYDRSLAIRPDRAAAWNNRGYSLEQILDYRAASASYARALEIEPGYPEALINLATSHHREGRQREAIGYLDRRLGDDRADARARLLRVMYSIPVIYRDEEEIASARQEYASRLYALRREIEEAGEWERFSEVFGAVTPFHLPYQGFDDRELQHEYGTLACRIAEARFKILDLPRPADHDRIRIGIVSSFFRRHTVWHLMLKAWVGQFDRARFEIYGYHTSGISDACTSFARANCDRFVQGPLSVADWRKTILADAPNIILYPEVGMDPVASQLASQRLARVQCNSWGHPETSGYPTLDYFLSSEAMELDEGESAYTERLVKLPGLGIYYDSAEATGITVSREEFGLPPDAMVFWCCQSLQKYLPRYDEVFPLIARDVPKARFVFIAYPHGNIVTEIFRERLTAAFARLGLDQAEFCLFIPRLDPSRFAAAFAVSDVVLDSIGWSGGQTTLESLPHCRPIVAMNSPPPRCGRATLRQFCN